MLLAMLISNPGLLVAIGLALAFTILIILGAGGVKTHFPQPQGTGNAFVSSNYSGNPMEPKGNIFYVCSTNTAHGGTTSGYGFSPESPFLTLAAALAQCANDNTDVIYILPGHAETFSAASGAGAGFSIGVTGVTIIGLGNGVDRPTFTFTATGATTAVTAGGVTISNCLFVCGVNAITTLMTISGADCTLNNIETREDSTNHYAAVNTITVTGARLTVNNFYHNGYTGGSTNTAVFSMNGVAGANFINGKFYTASQTAIVNFVTTACTDILFDGVTFYVQGVTNFTKDVVDTITGSTWVLTGCFDMGAGTPVQGGSGAAVSSFPYTSGAVSGAEFCLTGNILSSDIVQTNTTAMLTVSGGPIMVEDIILETDATGIAGPTNLNFNTDNVSGLTGTSNPLTAQAVSGLGANKTVSMKASATTTGHFPFTIESGKHLFAAGTAANGTGGGNCRVTFLLRRINPASTAAVSNV